MHHVVILSVITKSDPFSRLHSEPEPERPYKSGGSPVRKAPPGRQVHITCNFFTTNWLSHVLDQGGNLVFSVLIYG